MSLIGATDPIAVISTLRQVAISKRLEVEMQGEALFNDGVGIVLVEVPGDHPLRRDARLSPPTV